MQSANSLKQDMEKTLGLLEEDLRSLRPGRASAELISSLPVECYGSAMPLQQVAALSNDEQGSLIVQAWDKSVLGAIEKAIKASQLGFSVVNDGAVIRLSLPPMSQERRLEMVKLLHQKGEAARVQLRQIRGDAMQAATGEKKAGTIREDDLTRYTKELDQIIGDFNNRIKVVVEAKEKELLNA